MNMKILAYKSNDEVGGESIVIRMFNSCMVCCAEDIDEIIKKLQAAKEHALTCNVEDEEVEFIPHV